MGTTDKGTELSPWPVRVAVYLLLILLALAAIRVIDRRAMILQREYEQQHGQVPVSDDDTTTQNTR